MSTRLASWCVAACTAVLICSTGCIRHDARLAQHQKALDSLRATTAAIAHAWMAGDLSGTYTRTALEQTYYLVERERTTLGQSPQLLADPRGARLSDTAEQMSRLLAAMIVDVRASDTSSVRDRLAELPMTGPFDSRRVAPLAQGGPENRGARRVDAPEPQR